MKYLKRFNESNYNESDIDIVRNIFNNELYHSKTSLEIELSKVKDNKIKKGLIVELFIRKDLYDIEDTDYLIDLIDLLNIDGIEDAEEAHDYYVDSISKSVKIKYLEYQDKFSDPNFSEKDFIDWIKSLSEEEVKDLIEFLLEDEIYEMISIIKSLRK